MEYTHSVYNVYIQSAILYPSYYICLCFYVPVITRLRPTINSDLASFLPCYCVGEKLLSFMLYWFMQKNAKHYFLFVKTNVYTDLTWCCWRLGLSRLLIAWLQGMESFSATVAGYFPPQKASIVKLCFLRCWCKHTEQAVEFLVIWDAFARMWRDCNELLCCDKIRCMTSHWILSLAWCGHGEISTCILNELSCQYWWA